MAEIKIGDDIINIPRGLEKYDLNGISRELCFYIIQFYEIINGGDGDIDNFFLNVKDVIVKRLFNCAHAINYMALYHACASEWKHRMAGFYTIDINMEDEMILPVQMALKMGLINTMHNYDISRRKFFINANKYYFGCAIAYLYISNDKERYEIEKPITKKYAPQWALEYIANYKTPDLKLLAELCNYLDFKELLNLACAELALRIMMEMNYAKLKEYFY